MDQIKSIKENLINCVTMQINGNMEQVDAQELGEVIDMIKDLAEVEYYCSITDAMESYEPIRESDRMYYGGKHYNHSSYRYANDTSYPSEIRDYREGKSPITRRNYMESKELHKDKNTQMHELEKYMKELSSDLYEMIEDATSEEKQMLHQKLATLAEKIQ